MRRRVGSTYLVGQSEVVCVYRSTGGLFLVSVARWNPQELYHAFGRMRRSLQHALRHYPPH